MTTFGWLHLTDLHQGSAAQGWMLPEVMSELHRDIESLHADGGFDLVLFTGDLTQSGSAAQFDLLDRTLDTLRARLDKLGSQPVLLAVPGNHDLARPNARDPAVRTLLRWGDNEDVHDEFWTDASSAYRAVVDKSFAEYSAWWSRFGHGFRKPAGLKTGLLPGDFSAFVEKDGARLGVVGLNTSFLHLADSIGEGHLALHARQFQAVCDGDGPGWAERCDVALLLTHHPPAWLDPPSRDDHLYANIAVPGRFAVHLFGHMHESSASSVAVAGMEARRLWQGTSLFGLETLADGKTSRAHGYSAGRLKLGPRDAELRLWPRKAERTQAKSWQIVPDTSFGRLERDQGTKPEVVQRRRVAPPPRPSASSSPTGPRSPVVWKPQAPGGAYDPAWYVHRERDERRALSTVPNPGAPAVVVWGPPLYGKTTFVRHVLAELPKTVGEGAVEVVEINLATFEQALAGEAAFMIELGNRIARESGNLPHSGNLPEWPAARARGKLEELMADQILPRDGRLFVLVIERLDALLPSPFRENVFDMFRTWVQETEDPWSALRLIVVAASTPSNFQRRATRSPFLNTSLRINLGEFDTAQTANLAERYHLDWSSADLARLRSVVGGHPFLLRAFMYEAALGGTALDELLDPGSFIGQELRQRAVQMLPDLGESVEAALRLVVQDRKVRLPEDVAQALCDAGLLDHDKKAGIYSFRCQLHEDYFTEQWKPS